MLDHASVPRCVTETLRRVEGTWIMVCLTCPTFRGHNARRRTYVSHAEASMAGRDHARAKLRYRIKRAEHARWIRRVLDADSWGEFVAVGRELYPFNWGVVTPDATDAAERMAYTKTQLTYALEMMGRELS